MQQANRVLSQPMEMINSEKLEEALQCVEQEERIYCLASEIEQTLHMHIHGRGLFFGNISRDI
ncbi:uncharacterized protein NEMAJ01_1161 [Nematocida major]|uniref:uncharacterized protein n=1 Tax=Nematocida major TaxID=1912982 RepID=UPI00200794A4|nr:uncharacterized protein NEMAJ01_1161 [Nematocida major]KAH9386265.1 hypothetical protein NEMAJ01_1161 [Nematocida major]